MTAVVRESISQPCTVTMTAQLRPIGVGTAGEQRVGVAAADFDAFVRQHTAALLRTAFLLTGNHHAAEELLQDTFVHLYPQWSRVHSADSPVAYVRRTLTNRFVSSRRTRASRDLAVWELPDGWDGEDLAESIATRRATWQLLARLPDRQRAAVVLRYVNDLPDDEIAAILGCRPATVRSLLSRGLAALRTGAGLSGAPFAGTGAPR
jgi:RNA polymerase sigma-70 factor (sigma-E family)